MKSGAWDAMLLAKSKKATIVHALQQARKRLSINWELSKEMIEAGMTVTSALPPQSARMVKGAQ